MNDDKKRIIQGEVFYQNQWMSAEKKEALEKKRKKKIEEGYVFHHGEWITIAEKLARIAPAGAQQNIIVNQTFNQQTYDQRTVHEHKHVHLDAETLGAYTRQRQDASLGARPGTRPGTPLQNPSYPGIESTSPRQGTGLPDRSDRHYLADKSHQHFLADRRGEEVGKKEDEVSIEDIGKDTNRQDTSPKKYTPENIIDLENISDADVEEFLG